MRLFCIKLWYLWCHNVADAAIFLFFNLFCFYKLYSKRAARKDKRFTLPSPALTDGSLDFSFSGLKTAAINLLHHHEQTGEPLDRALFAARYTYEAVEAVAKKTAAAWLWSP